MLDAGRSCPGTMLLDAAGTVGLARCAAYGAGATLGLAWVGAFAARALMKSGFNDGP